MKALITGLAGFIGFHAAKRFSFEGYHVAGFDNFNDYYDQRLKRTRASILRDECNIECKPLDLRHKEGVKQLILREKPQLVVHLGAMAGVRHSMDDPQSYIDNNITGSMNLILACEEAGVQDVIFASTSCVMHGNPLRWTESAVFHHQINPYGYTKCVNESQFAISKIPNAVGLRLFTAYGPWGRPDTAIFGFTKNILEGQPIALFNHGRMKRDFTYVDDVVEAIWLVSQNITAREIYNVGYGEQVELEHLVAVLESAVGKSAIRRYVPQHPADVTETWSDSSKLGNLGFRPEISIETGVERFVGWYSKYFGRFAG